MEVDLMDFKKLVERFTEVSFSITDVHWFVREPGSCARGIYTDWCSFVFPITGKANFAIGGVEYELKAGKVMHCGSNEVLDKCVLGNLPWGYYEIYYKLNNPTQEDSKTIDKTYILDIGDISQIKELLHEMLKTYRTPGIIPEFKVKKLFYSIIYEVLVSNRDVLNSENQWVVEDAVDYIHNNYMYSITLEDLSNRYKLKEDKFSYIFNKYTGIRPINYLIEHRMKIAEKLLATNKYSVNAVSEKVGYSDPYYFSRLFKKHKNISPSELKKRFKNNPL